MKCTSTTTSKFRARGTIAALVLGAAVATTGGQASADSVEPGERTCFGVSGTPGDAAVVNLTPVGALGGGSGQLVSSDLVAPPVYSNVNFGPGTIDPNIAVSAIGADGRTCFVNNGTARTGIIADHLGTIDAASYSPATPGGAPARVVDTRRGLGGARLAPGDRACFGVDGDPGDAALVNLTPVRASGTGNGKLVSSDVSAPPVFSNVNYASGSIDPNVAVAAIGSDGQVCFVNADLASVDLVADHLGTVDAAAYTPATPSGAPARVVDTRSSLGGTRLAPGGRLCFAVDGDPGDAAVVNLTPVLATGRGNGQLVSSDVPAPPVYSNVNWNSGSIDPNVAVAEIGADSRTCFVNNAPGSVDLIADHMGTIDAVAYTPASSSGAPVRSLDSRATASRADLVLRPNGVGGAPFGRDADSTIAYFESGLGANTFDATEHYPIPDSSLGYRSADFEGFAFPYSREVCFTNDFCATFGGSTPTTLQFVGYVQSDMGTSAPLTLRSGATVGDRGDTSPGVVTVANGGCYSIGDGTVDGIDAILRSDGVPFLEITPDLQPVLNTPPLADVEIIWIYAGDRVIFLEGDC